MEVKFIGKKTKIGTSYYVLIPKPISELLNADEEYDFIINEKSGDKNGNQF